MSTAIQMCETRGGYAEWECTLSPGHEGNHRDALGREWDESESGTTPVIDPDKITDRHALRIAEDYSGYNDTGSIEIDGITVEWWADEESVWFYNPGDDGENTIKRFSVDREISVYPTSGKSS